MHAFKMNSVTTWSGWVAIHDAEYGAEPLNGWIATSILLRGRGRLLRAASQWWVCTCRGEAVFSLQTAAPSPHPHTHPPRPTCSFELICPLNFFSLCSADDAVRSGPVTSHCCRHGTVCPEVMHRAWLPRVVCWLHVRVRAIKSCITTSSCTARCAASTASAHGTVRYVWEKDGSPYAATQW